VRWDDFEGVERRRIGFYPVDVLIFRAGRVRRSPAQVAGHERTWLLTRVREHGPGRRTVVEQGTRPLMF
jgi:hypothetical protein